jgi:hypothetical protein
LPALDGDTAENPAAGGYRSEPGSSVMALGETGRL